MKEFVRKIKLENKLIDTSNNNFIQMVINCYQKQWYQIQVMKSIWRGSPNVEPVDLGCDSILEDFDSLIKE